MFSGLSGVVAGGWVTFRVQRGLAQKLRDDNRSAVAAMFVADIRMMNEWLRRTNLLKGVQHLRDALSKGKRSDPAFLALLKLFEINVTELDETMFRKQASLAGALGLLAADVAIVYTSAISLQSNVQALLGDLYQEFSEAMNEIVEKDPRSSAPQNN